MPTTTTTDTLTERAIAADLMPDRRRSDSRSTPPDSP